VALHVAMREHPGAPLAQLAKLANAPTVSTAARLEGLQKRGAVTKVDGVWRLIENSEEGEASAENEARPSRRRRLIPTATASAPTSPPS
jgi:hypothetical protein